MTGNSRIENCEIVNNNRGPGIQANPPGGEIGGFDAINCLITGHEEGVIGWSKSAISNSIVYGNDVPGVRYVDVTYSNIEGGEPGEGNIDADPMLIMDSDGRYYLSQTAAGQDQDSPCLDAGQGLASKTFVTVPEGTIALSTLTTRTDRVADVGKVDMGPHLNLPDIIVPDLVTGVSIYMPSDEYTASDLFRCEVIVTNDSDNDLSNYPLMVLLECYGEFFFAPSFSSEMDSYVDVYLSFAPGETLIPVLHEFAWPDVGMGESTWYAALLDPDFTFIIGEWDMKGFSWR